MCWRSSISATTPAFQRRLSRHWLHRCWIDFAQPRLTTGLTTAVNLVCVASVAMATGVGHYLTAIFATGLVLVALFSLGHLELTFNLKTLSISYEVTGASVEQVRRRSTAFSNVNIA